MKTKVLGVACRRASIWLLVFITGAFCTPVHADTLDVYLPAGTGPVEFSYVGPTTTFTAHISGFGGEAPSGVYPRDPRPGAGPHRSADLTR